MHSSYTGKAGEHLVIGELLKRGIMVHLPAVDEGADLIAGERFKVQVKTRRKEKSRWSGYNFTLGQKRESGTALAAKLRAKTMAEWFPRIDFLVCVGLGENGENRFWIFPKEILKRYPTRQSLLLGSGHHHHFSVDEMHRLLKAGMTHAATAEKLGISEHTVWMHVNGRTNRRKAEDVLAIAADRYENAWHEIEQAVKLASSIDELDGVDIESLVSPTERDAAESWTGNEFFTDGKEIFADASA